MKRIGAVLGVAATSIAVISIAVIGIAAQAQTNYMPLDIPAVSGLVHLQNYGDRPLANGQWTGTRGESRRLEGLALRLGDTHGALRIEYRCHPHGMGEEGPLAEGAFCGTRGQSRPLDAVQIRLTGPAAAFFSVHYQCTIAGTGDSPEMSDNAVCAAPGASRQLEAIRVWIVRRNG